MSISYPAAGDHESVPDRPQTDGRSMPDLYESRSIIGKAIGIIMARYNLDDERAFDYLRRLSNDSNIKLRHIAETVIAEANQRASPTDQTA